MSMLSEVFTEELLKISVVSKIFACKETNAEEEFNQDQTQHHVV